MTGITTYTPGAFCWADLSSPDQPASKDFYTKLFGWSSSDSPMGEGMVYSEMRVDGKAAAGIAPAMPGEAGPVAWAVYVNVESADAAVERARSLGATVVGEGAFDVPDAGRMALISDPAGSVFRVWEPTAHAGAQVMQAAGALSWFELSSSDVDAVTSFYSQMFDWKVAAPAGMEDYLIATTAAGEGTGAIMAAQGPATGWLVYFGSDDVDASLAAAKEHGAAEVVPATDIPGNMGRFAVMRDPQGAVFGLYKFPPQAAA